MKKNNSVTNFNIEELKKKHIINNLNKSKNKYNDKNNRFLMITDW